MPTKHKVLGQAAPLAATDTDLYTVPADTEAVVSTIVVCNRTGDLPVVRVAVRPDGAALAPEHYIAHDTPTLANDSIMLTLGVTLDAGDVVTVRTSQATVSFSMFGAEITP
jgi:hypothetical protein